MNTLVPGARDLQLASPQGPLDAVWLVPTNAVAVVVLAHGAGAGCRHKTMEAIATAFAEVGLATLRFNFPYMQAGKNRVDSKDVAVETIVNAVACASSASNLPLFLGGHSFGGRMASHAVAQASADCAGLIFCSFPLHGAKKPDDKRAQHLTMIHKPMLFLSGTRDDLADQALLTQVVEEQQGRAQIHWLETGNHSYVVLKRTRTNPLPIFAEMAQEARRFVDAAR